MKKFLMFFLTVCLSSMLFSGCTTSNSSNVISTDGSTSMEKLIGYLSEGYMEENNGIKVTYNPTGSGSGIKAVQSESCNIGLSSRELKDEEKSDLESVAVAIDGIAMIVNPENPIGNLSIEQISALFKGEITNWKDLGGENAAVVLIGREAASGTRDGFESITDTVDKCKYSQELTSTGDVIQTVSSNPNAIGYASLASIKDNVKVLSVEDIYPSKETIQSGKYKLQRNFLFVIKKNAELSDAAKDFFIYVTSGNADELIEKAGAIPVSR